MKKPLSRILGPAAVLVAASAAFAQPAAIDLGSVGAGTTRTESGAIAGNQVIWYQFDLTDEVSIAALRFADFDTVGSTPLDTEIGVYTASGALVATDDDDAEGTRSALSFGSGSDLLAGTGGTISNGRDGTLLPGRYYVAVALFNATFGTTNWNVTSTATATGNYTLNININNFVPPSPPAATDLGTLGPIDGRMVTGESLAAGEIKWFRVEIPAISNALATYFDGDTEGSALLPTNDTRFAVYNVLGRVVTADSDDGSGSLSQFSYGLTTPVRPAVGNSLAYNGRDGALAAGVYYIAVGGGATAAVVFNPGFAASSTAANSGTFNLNLRTGAVSSNPVIDGGFAPFTAVNNCGNAVTLLTASIVPGANPTSTSYTVTVDLTALGGPSNATMFNDGTNGDVTAGDNIFSLSYQVPETATLGLSQPVFTVVDGEGRTDTDTGDITIVACPTGACCTGASCSIVTESACVTSGGSYLGDNSTCFSNDSYSITDSSNALEDISATGNLGPATDDSSVLAPLGFSFTYFGNTYTDINICSNGFLNFGAANVTFTNTAIPNAAAPNDAIYPMWDDFNPGAAGDVFYQTLGTPGVDLRFIAQWNAITQFGGTDSNTFQAVLFENGTIEFRYGAISAFPDADATVGVENSSGTLASSVPASTIVSNSAKLLTFVPGGSPNCSGPACAWQADGCYADFNNDEGIDGDDVIAFFGEWDNSLPCADVDLSDGVDGDDVIVFFGSWDVAGTGFPGC